ncbi:MAG: amidohydrolase family protein [Spirochaetaceae bacterium]|nr:MAG: amidohydrolase family protein [Spirochaetaceae bacterium]
MLSTYSLSGATLVTPERIIRDGRVKIEKNRVKSLTDGSKVDIQLQSGVYCYPALINVHDHLRGDYLPRIGPQNGDYYLNWSYWERDLRNSPVLVERAKISVEQMYLLSAYKNLFSGVVTVNDHFPHEFNEPLIPLLPVRVINSYTLAHECSSFDLNWGDGIEIEHRRAVERGHPFITHLEEGFDAESQSGVDILENLNCLDEHDVLIHCIGFSDSDIRRVQAAGASVAWCPASNMFMFNVTCKIRKMIAQGVNVCIGTDSTATGSVNLFEEIRFAREVYRSMYGEELDAETLLRMVTIHPAKAFWMQDKIGTVEEGKYADLLFIRPREDDPYEALVSARMEDIELIIQEGTPIYGDGKFEELFHRRNCDYTTVQVRGRRMCVKGDPAGLLERIRRAVGFNKVLDYLPFGE